MSASVVVHKFCSLASCFPNCRQNRTLALTHHQFHSPNSLLKLKTQPFLSHTNFKSSTTQKPRSTFVVFAAQSNFFKALAILVYLVPLFSSIAHPGSLTIALSFYYRHDYEIVLQNAWKVGRDGIEAGTNLVPNSVPRPIARISVTIVALSVTLFVLKAFLSTAFFVLATIGLAYFAYLAFNKDQGPSENGGTTSTPMDDPVEEARKIMEKYK